MRPLDSVSHPSELLALVHDGLPVGVWVARASDGGEVYANARFAEILGTGLQNTGAGSYVTPYGIHTRDGGLYPEDRLPFVRALRERGPVEQDDIVIHRGDGTRAFVRAFAKPLFGAGGEPEYVVVAFIDISREVDAERERELSDARAQRAARFESIGKLAGGIAHDFNNLLSVVRTTTLLLEKEPDAERRARDLVLIRDMADRAASLTRALRSFSGRAISRREPVELGPLVTSLAPIFERAVDARIRVVVNARTTRAVLGDASELEQLVMNLVMNARDAMPEGGALTIDVRDDGDVTLLEVMDTGPGIPAAVREQVFEPYFTTKSPRAFPGAGLGLATVYGVVQGHGGTVVVGDAPGGGALLTVRLPSVAAPAASTPPSPAPRAEVRRPTTPALVLVAEDDDVVRFISERALQSLGYEVVTAKNGDEALDAIDRSTRTFDVVLLDVHMPIRGGVSTFRVLRERNPSLPVVFLTGYSDEAEQREMLDLGVDACLSKPVTIEALDEALRRAIDHGRSSGSGDARDHDVDDR